MHDDEEDLRVEMAAATWATGSTHEEEEEDSEVEEEEPDPNHEEDSFSGSD